MHNHSTGILQLFYISKHVLGACVWKNVRKKQFTNNDNRLN